MFIGLQYFFNTIGTTIAHMTCLLHSHVWPTVNDASGNVVFSVKITVDNFTGAALDCAPMHDLDWLRPSH